MLWRIAVKSIFALGIALGFAIGQAGIRIWAEEQDFLRAAVPVVATVSSISEDGEWTHDRHTDRFEMEYTYTVFVDYQIGGVSYENILLHNTINEEDYREGDLVNAYCALQNPAYIMVETETAGNLILPVIGLILVTGSGGLFIRSCLHTMKKDSEIYWSGKERLR